MHGFYWKEDRLKHVCEKEFAFVAKGKKWLGEAIRDDSISSRAYEHRCPPYSQYSAIFV